MFHKQGHRVIIVDKGDTLDDQGPAFYDHAIAANLLEAKTLPDIVKQVGDTFGRVGNQVFEYAISRLSAMPIRER